jgi:hypothetical protein
MCYELNVSFLPSPPRLTGVGFSVLPSPQTLSLMERGFGELFWPPFALREKGPGDEGKQ